MGTSDSFTVAATSTPLPCSTVTCVLAGAAGNLIDRAMFGAVTDMFNFTFIRFGVFNVADMWVVGGVIGYCAYLLFTQFKGTKDSQTADPGEDGHEADP